MQNEPFKQAPVHYTFIVDLKGGVNGCPLYQGVIEGPVHTVPICIRCRTARNTVLSHLSASSRYQEMTKNIVIQTLRRE